MKAWMENGKNPEEMPKAFLPEKSGENCPVCGLKFQHHFIG